MGQLLGPSWEDPNRAKAQEYQQCLTDLGLPNTKAAFTLSEKLSSCTHGARHKNSEQVAGIWNTILWALPFPRPLRGSNIQKHWATASGWWEEVPPYLVEVNTLLPPSLLLFSSTMALHSLGALATIKEPSDLCSSG